MSSNNGAVRIGVHGIVDLHLQDQVRAALQVEAQVNPVCDRGQQASAGPILGNAKNAAYEQQRYDQNHYHFQLQRFHKNGFPVSRLWILAEHPNRATRNQKLQTILTSFLPASSPTPPTPG